MPPVKGRPWKLPHYANRGKTSSSRGELASARSCFSTVRTALGKLRITGLLARFDVARSFPQFPRPLLLQPTIWTSERGADLGSGRCQPRPHLPIYRMTRICLVEQGIFWGEQGKPVRGTGKTSAVGVHRMRCESQHRSGQRGSCRRMGFAPRLVRSKYSADPQVSIVQQVVTVTANRSQPWLSPNVFPLCV